LLVEALASCTAITYVNGSLVGDPLDVQMFEATGWILDENDQIRIKDNGNQESIIASVYPREACNAV
jgi:cation-transporting ATPase 13A3/4/5